MMDAGLILAVVLVQMVWCRGASGVCDLLVISSVLLISWLFLSHVFCGQWCVSHWSHPVPAEPLAPLLLQQELVHTWC